MISGETLDNSYFKMRFQHCLQAVCILIRCRSQRFVLKPQSFIKLASIEIIGAQSLNCSRSVSNRRIIGDCFEQGFGFVSLALSIDSESVIVLTYLPRSFYRQVHQYSAHVFKRIEVAPEVGLLCKLNQCIGEFEE